MKVRWLTFTAVGAIGFIVQLAEFTPGRLRTTLLQISSD